jgi:hypothetical protein
VYLDDIIVFSETLEEHIEHVRLVVERLIQFNLKIKLKKCKIAQTSIEYLSHIISNGTITPSPAKVADLMKYNSPLNAAQIHSYVGLGSFYRRFIAGFASIVSPLLRAIHEKPLIWTHECQQAFEFLRNKLTSEPLLALPEFDKPFSVETDACNYGVGAVLSQLKELDWLPVAYFSRHLSKVERNYSTTEKELYAIVLAVEHFKQFLYGIEFKVITDHQPLKYLFSIKEPASRLIRWMLRLSMYRFKIFYRKGIKNGNADALSRLPTEPEENETVEDEEPIVINVIINEVEEQDSEQLLDPNLRWLFSTKIKAQEENRSTFTTLEFENRDQEAFSHNGTEFSSSMEPCTELDLESKSTKRVGFSIHSSDTQTRRSIKIGS